MGLKQWWYQRYHYVGDSEAGTIGFEYLDDIVNDAGDDIIVVIEVNEELITSDVDGEVMIEANDTVASNDTVVSNHLWPLYIGRVSMERGRQSSSWWRKYHDTTWYWWTGIYIVYFHFARVIISKIWLYYQENYIVWRYWKQMQTKKYYFGNRSEDRKNPLLPELNVLLRYFLLHYFVGRREKSILCIF